MTFADVFSNFIDTTGFAYLIADPRCLIMIAISCVLLYLAIVKGFEPLLLVPIAFGMLLTNLPGANMFHPDYFLKVVDGATAINWAELGHGAGLIDYLYLGVKLGIYPSLIFMGVGAMTDFGPLIANPKSLLMGAGAQFGIFVAFIGAKLLGFSNAEAGSIGIIGGADGPTAIYVTLRLAPYLLGPIAVAAYSYMALVPVIQPPIMKALTTKEERRIEMKQLRPVSQKEKIIFPIMVTIFVSFMLPSAAPLIGLLMLGNLFRESGVVYKVLKNTYIKRAADELGITGLDADLNGPTAVAFGIQDPAAPAKILKEFIADKKKMTVKCGIVDKQYIDANGVKALADLPSREVLIAKMLGSMNAPITGLVSVLGGTVRKLLYALNAVADSKNETAA